MVVVTKLPKQRQGTQTLLIRVLLINENGPWVAQGLDYDIAAQGRTIQEAMKAFQQTLLAQIRADLSKGRNPLQDFEHAPDMYWSAYERAEPLQNRPILSLPQEVPPAFMIGAIYEELRVYS